MWREVEVNPANEWQQYMKGSNINTNSKVVDTEFCDVMLRMFNELKEMIPQIFSKTQESMKVEMRKLRSDRKEE